MLSDISSPPRGRDQGLVDAFKRTGRRTKEDSYKIPRTICSDSFIDRCMISD